MSQNYFDALLASTPSPWVIKWHAVERYIERVDPEVSCESAIAEIARLSQHASYTGRTTYTGEDVWVAPNGVRLIVKQIDSWHRKPTLVTLLGPEPPNPDVDKAASRAPTPRRSNKQPKRSRAARIARNEHRQRTALKRVDGSGDE